MKKLYTLLFLTFAFSVSAQTNFTQWDFDASTTTPTIGTGTITIIGGVAEAGTPYPAGNPATGKAYSISTFPAAGTASGTAGYQFSVNTTNYAGITIKFDPRGSGTASKWQQYEYTTNGTVWNVLGNNGGTLINGFTATPMVTLNMPAGADNNPNFAFRIVSIFDPAGSDYASVTGGATAYSSAGTWRIDNVTFTGTMLGVQQNAIAGLNIYPNPVSNGTLFIDTNANADKKVVVYNVLGKQVLSTTTSGNSINVGSLNNGVYIVKVTEEGKTATRKLVIR